MRSLWGLDPQTWRPHALHDPDRTYVEANCHLDAIIEVVAAAGGDPTAMLGIAVTTDFEVDQWTFLKPAEVDLRTLYGIDARECAPYLPLVDHVVARLDVGQTLMPEVDAFHLPDTAGTSYHADHVRTSIVVEAIDVPSRRMRYFHNSRYAEVSAADFDAVLGLDERDNLLPLGSYCDQIRFNTGPLLTGDALREAAADATREHLERRPAHNPFPAFAAFVEEHMGDLVEGDLAVFHALAFATVRMAGSSFELLATHVRWLLGEEAPAAGALDEVVAGCKMIGFRMARRRPFDVAVAVEPLGAAWALALEQLQDALDRPLAPGSTSAPR